jgi:signal recognition particle subunit SRP54
VRIDPSRPPGDAPCPHCGHLLWFEPQKQNVDEGESVEQENGVLELVERAQQTFGRKEMAEQEARLRQGEFTLTDFKNIADQAAKLGPIEEIASMIPDMRGVARALVESDSHGHMRRVSGIIEAMTPEERGNPTDVLDENRCRRIARGAGVTPAEVNELVRQFEVMADLMRKLGGMSIKDRLRLLQNRA